MKLTILIALAVISTLHSDTASAMGAKQKYGKFNLEKNQGTYHLSNGTDNCPATVTVDGNVNDNGDVYEVWIGGLFAFTNINGMTADSNISIGEYSPNLSNVSYMPFNDDIDGNVKFNGFDAHMEAIFENNKFSVGNAVATQPIYPENLACTYRR